MLIPSSITRAARARFELSDPHGVHGPAHWARVMGHGRAMAAALNQDPQIPVLFGLLHDTCRENEHHDPFHGARAANFIDELAGRSDWSLGRSATELLKTACRDHSDGYVDAPLLVQICWDADRLDLGRVGITPDPSRLCTDAARQRVGLALAWSRGAVLRDYVAENSFAPGLRFR